jgi:hypothetical protein
MGFLTGTARSLLPRALGCNEVLTEDIIHGRDVAGVRTFDPF